MFHGPSCGPRFNILDVELLNPVLNKSLIILEWEAAIKKAKEAAKKKAVEKAKKAGLSRAKAERAGKAAAKKAAAKVKAKEVRHPE